MNLVGFVGFQNCGKNTAALVLEELGYKQISFADSLKDCLSVIFQWNRDMLNGITPESRAWREQIDVWWAERLGIPDFTPRMAMQQVGTNSLRQHFHPDIWISSVEKKMECGGGNFVFTDLRYPNEIDLVRRKGGKIIRIKKGDDPEWFELAKDYNAYCRKIEDPNVSPFDIPDYYPCHPFISGYAIHETEYAWIGSEFDDTLENNSSIEELHKSVIEALKKAGGMIPTGFGFT